MKTYTVWQKPGYEVLRTSNKQEAENKLKEMQKYDPDRYYICEQGKNDSQKAG